MSADSSQMHPLHFPWVALCSQCHLLSSLLLKAENFILQRTPLRSLPNKPNWLLVSAGVASLVLSLRILAIIHLRLTRTRAASRSYLSNPAQIELLMKPRSEWRDLGDQTKLQHLEPERGVCYCHGVGETSRTLMFASGGARLSWRCRYR